MGLYRFWFTRKQVQKKKYAIILNLEESGVTSMDCGSYADGTNIIVFFDGVGRKTEVDGKFNTTIAPSPPG